LFLGFSGREISKMAIAWQAAARATPECNITKEMMQQIVDERVKQHKQKEEWEMDRPY